MSGRIAPPRIEWIDRQLAAGADLRAALRFLDARRARHLRGAHGTWGVALGFDVEALTASMPQTVSVGPGLAYDAAGRELLLTRPQTLTIPAQASGTATLVATTGGDACLPGVRLRLAWREQPVQLGQDVPLATIDLATDTIDQSRRPHIRSAAPPRVAGGRVEVGAAAAQGTSFAFAVAVDTSAGGFEQVPRYLVEPSLGSATMAAPTGILGPLLAIEDPTAAGFSLVVRHLAATAADVAAADALERPLFAVPFAFTWVGVEPPPIAGIDGAGAPPPLTLL